MSRMERLDKLVSVAFAMSRAQAREAIKRGRVTAEGEVLRSFDARLPDDTALCLDGAEGIFEKYVYIMMDKPEGYLSATEDSREPTALDLLPQELTRRRLGIVGRLDKDATGLLLITDDGELNHRLTSPKYHMDKRYFVICDKALTGADVSAFAEGMELSDFKAMPALLEIDPQKPTHAFVTIREGKFHQVKRMFERVGATVIALRRLSIGGLALDGGLGEGGYRRLTAGEKSYLLEKCGIKQ